MAHHLPASRVLQKLPEEQSHQNRSEWPRTIGNVAMHCGHRRTTGLLIRRNRQKLELTRQNCQRLDSSLEFGFPSLLQLGFPSLLDEGSMSDDELHL
jgi:hypothetical protein